MKKSFFLLLVSCISSLAGIAQSNKVAPLSAVVQQVAECWQDVDLQNKNGIKLKSLTASFSVSKTRSAGGGINIWIFKIGRKVEKNKVSKVILELAKGDGSQRALTGSAANQPLTQFINATLADFKKMDDAKLLPDLNQRTVTIEVGLTITKTNSAGGEYEIGIFSLSAEAGRNSETANTLTLVFGK